MKFFLHLIVRASSAMMRKRGNVPALLATGFLLGFVFSWFVWERRPSGVIEGAQEDSTSAHQKNEHASSIAEFENQLELLKGENETLRARLAEVTSVDTRRPATDNQLLAMSDDLLERTRAAARERDTELLLAAGYSKDRIDWLRKRSQELQAERRQLETDRRTRGLPIDPVKELAYLFDHDIELRYEIGDDEYEKYLRALDRPVNVEVKNVLQGSIADSVGILPGDVILRYDGKRVFNLGELNGLAMNNVGGSYAVTVMRQGQLMQFQVPGGIIGIQSRNLVPQLGH